MQTLPPADDEVSNYLSVCFNNQKMTTADVGKHKALKIDPQEYIRCSELRKKVCPVFAEVRIDKEQVRTQWPDGAVPAAILQGAQGMDTLHTFKPTLDGPASMKAPTCNLPSDDQDPRVIDDDGAAAESAPPPTATANAVAPIILMITVLLIIFIDVWPESTILLIHVLFKQIYQFCL